MLTCHLGLHYYGRICLIEEPFFIGRYFLSVMVPLWYDITYQVDTGKVRKRF